MIGTEIFRKTTRDIDTVITDWLTLPQLEEWYKDPETARAHKAEMEVKPLHVVWRPHSDLPNHIKATLYSVTTSSAKRKEVERLLGKQT